MHTIYEIVCRANGKKYIGQTIWTHAKRFYHHNWVAQHEGKNPLSYAIRKYGVENFVVNPICEAKNQEETDKLEKFFIKLFDSTNPEKGYNLAAGGSYPVWWTGKKRPPLSPEHCQKLITSRIGRKNSPEHRKAISESMKGNKHGSYKHTPEQKLAASIRAKEQGLGTKIQRWN